MKINWDRWVKRDRGTLLFAGYTLIIAAIIVSTIKFSRAKVKSAEDLHFISAQFKTYEFIDGNKGYHNYQIWLKGYSNAFKISADFLSLFHKTKFINSPSDSSLTLSIAKEDLNILNKNNDYLMIFSLTDSSENYLDLTETIKRYNSNQDYIYFGILFLLGIILLYFGYKSKIKAPIF